MKFGIVISNTLILIGLMQVSARAELHERSISEYERRFPESRQSIFEPDEAPGFSDSQKGHALLGNPRVQIFDRRQIPSLPTDFFLIVGSQWIFFDASPETVSEYLNQVTHDIYPPPVIKTSDVKSLDSEHQSYRAFLRTGLLGINIDQKCEALLSSRSLTLENSEHLYQFENCADLNNPGNIWVHESLSRDYLIEKRLLGRRATLMLYQTYTIIERHRIGVAKPPESVLLNVAISAAQEGFVVMMRSIPVQGRP